MAYTERDHADELERFDKRLRASGVSASAYLGLKVVQTKALRPTQILVDRKHHILFCGSANYARWRVDVGNARLAARRDLDRMIAAAWKRIGVDSPTETN
jgi:hypothetical protein